MLTLLPPLSVTLLNCICFTVSYSFSFSAANVAKRPVLDDALAREQYKEKVRLMAREHANSYGKLNSWIGEKRDYLNARFEPSSPLSLSLSLSVSNTRTLTHALAFAHVLACPSDLS